MSDPSYWSDNEHAGYPWVAIGDMSSSATVTETGRRVTEEGLRAARLRLGPPGTLIFSMYASLGHTAFLSEKSAWNQALLGIVPSAGVDVRFLRYSLESLKSRLMESARSNTQHNLNAEQVGNLSVRLPGLEEQRRIADFLDAETSRIERMLSKCKEIRDLLDERRFSVVYGMITGSSCESPKSRIHCDLGWMNSVPSHWNIVPLKHVARLGSGHTPSRTHPEYWAECTIPWISLFDVGAMRDVTKERTSSTQQKISSIGLANSSARIHPRGTVVLSRTASVGFSTIMDDDMAVSQHFVTWTCGPRLMPEFLLYTLRAMRDYFKSVQVGTTNVTVFMPDLYSIQIPLPSMEEQEAIVGHIREEAALVDSLSSKFAHELDLLAERRQALITAAVTGQLDVTTARSGVGA